MSHSTLWPHPGHRTTVTNGRIRWTKIAGSLGDDITAVASGRVVWSAPYTGYGNVVIIEAVDREKTGTYRFWYAGNDMTYVRVGDWVEQGTVIATMGLDPFLGRPQLSFAVFKGLKVIDHTRLHWQ